jgi:hypothetical protein
MNLTRFRRPKIVCSPSCTDFRARTNAVILVDMGHMLREEDIQEEQVKVGNPKPECG